MTPFAYSVIIVSVMKIIGLRQEELTHIIEEFLWEEANKGASTQWLKSPEGKRYTRFLLTLEKAIRPPCRKANSRTHARNT